jgi:hypothetical protein
MGESLSGSISTLRMSVASLAASVEQPSSPKLSKRNSIEPWKRPDYSMVDLFQPLCKDQGFETLLNVKLLTIIEGPLADAYVLLPRNKSCDKYTRLTWFMTAY